MKFLTAVALAVVMLWVPVDGVAQAEWERNSLRGLTGVWVDVRVRWDDRITNTSRENYTQRLRSAFELGILRIGLKVGDSDGYPTLNCVVNLHNPNASIVSFYHGVELQEIVVPWQGTGIAELDNAQYATTWYMENLGTVGIDNLESTATKLGEDCAEGFELEWRRANN